MQEPLVVALSPAAAGELLTLQRAAYVDQARLYGDADLPPLTQTLPELRAELDAVSALGAVVGGRLVGAVRTHAVDGVLHIGRLVVAPDWQGRGVGSSLLRAAEAARPPGVRSAALFTGHLSRDDLRLYARHGYVEQRREQVRPGLALVHLGKPLGPSTPRPEPSGDGERIRVLEESLWRGATRFDRTWMEHVLAADFTEVGRSGQAWSRTQILDMPAVELDAELPLPRFAVRPLGPSVALATYRSVVRVADGPAEHAQRSSLWVHGQDGWRITFHQGTPCEPGPD